MRTSALPLTFSKIKLSMNSTFPNILIPQAKHRLTSLVMALLLFCCFETTSTAQVAGERINLNMNANPTYNVSLQGLPPVGCGSTKTSYCVAQDDVCYTQAGLIDKVTYEDLQGVHMIDLSGPDTIRVKVTNAAGFLPSWPEAKLDVENGEDDIARFVVIQNTSGIPEFEALIIVDPEELNREDENTPKLQLLRFTIVSSYFTSAAGSTSKNIEIDIPFMILGPTDDFIDPRGVTTTPRIPYLILHDPPGDGSSSRFLASRQTCRNFSTSFLIGGSARVWGSAKFGFETSGVVPAEVYAQYTVGLTAGLEHRSQTETELCITTTQEFSTSDLDQNTGTSGDIFIGVGRRLEYGVAEALIFDPNTCSTRIEKRLAFRATGEQDKFAMTEQQIRQDIVNQQRLVDDPNTDISTKSKARSQIKTWNQVLVLNEQNKLAAINAANGPVNTFGGQTSATIETEINSTTTQSIESTISIAADVALEVGAEIQGTGVAGGVEIEIRSEFGESVTNSASNSRVTSYTLSDDDPNDLFTYRVGTDPMYGTPVFSLIESSTSSSCPYEGGLKIDQPKLTASSLCATGKNILIENVPVGSSANLNLNICNDSDFERTYWLALDGSSNNRGAKFTFAGTELNATDKGVAYTLAPNSCFNSNGGGALLAISQNPNAPNELNYNNIIVYLYPECEGTSLGELAIVDQINLSVRFNTDPNAIPRATVDGTPEDITPPTLSACPQSRTINNFPGACGERVQFALPSATDNCGTATVTQIEGPASNDNFFPGTTTVSFLATDQSGNTSTCSFTVTVNDNEAPSVTFCPADQTVNVAPGACSEIINYQLPTAFDNCTYALNRTAGPASGENFFPGTTTVTHTFTDNYNNTASCSFNITVIDNEAPTFTSCPTETIVFVSEGSCGTNVGYIAPNGMDNCGANLVRTAGPESGAFFSAGETTVTYTLTDATNNIATCSFQVIVIDNLLPTVTSCPDDITVDAAIGSCSQIVSYETPTATDNCQASMQMTAGFASGSDFPIGTTTVTHTFTDPSNNSIECLFNVTVVDNQSPSITNCPDSIVVTTAVDQCSMLVEWEAPSAVDNCAITDISSNKASGSLFEVGTDTIIYTFTDAVGNNSACTFEVIVNAGDPDFCNTVTSTEDLEEEGFQLSIFPNPAREQVNVKFTTEMMSTAQLRMFSANGQEVYEEQMGTSLGENNFSLDINRFAKGLYLLQLSIKNQKGIQVQNQRLVIN